MTDKNYYEVLGVKENAERTTASSDHEPIPGGESGGDDTGGDEPNP